MRQEANVRDHVYTHIAEQNIMKYENGKWITTYRAGDQVYWQKQFAPAVLCEVVKATVTQNGQGYERLQIRVIEDAVEYGTVFAKKGLVRWVNEASCRRKC